MNKYEEYLKMKRWDSQFRYMLLDRMRLDCDCLLSNVANHLWAGNITDQIGYNISIRIFCRARQSEKVAANHNDEKRGRAERRKYFCSF